MKYAMLATVVLTLAAALGAPRAMAQDSPLDYTVAGTNLNGSPYTGEARITLTSETTCDIEWITGATSSFGICMRNGPAFAAAYLLGDAAGLVIYQIMDDGTLEGLWTISGQEGTGTEVLTPK